jgi:hypothetical protein
MNKFLVMKLEGQQYIPEEDQMISLRRMVLNRAYRDGLNLSWVENIFDYPEEADKTPEELAESILIKDLVNVTYI